jgi:hypothetical protein
MATEAFESRRAGFEAEYFKQKDFQLVEKLKSVFHRKLEREELKRTAGITDEQVLDRLIAANVKGELLLVFKLYPLVAIAWADGKIDESESRAVIDAAIKSGMPPEGPAIKGLEEWLKRGPTEDGKLAWKMFAGELRTKLTPAELASFRNDLLSYAHSVAKASGGVFGFGGNESPSEKRVIEEMTKALTAG